MLSESAEFLYKCSDFYFPEDEHGVLWNDPDLDIAWNVTRPLLSPKDCAYPCLRDLIAAFLPVYQPEQ